MLRLDTKIPLTFVMGPERGADNNITIQEIIKIFLTI